MNKLVLCILDGWGCGVNSPHNAIALADTPFYDSLILNHPNAQLTTSGEAVGLPNGQMGNSEVGHLTIGTGRVIFQDLPRINKAISNGEIFSNPTLSKAIAKLKENNKTFHLIGLVSGGGIHGHIDHIIALGNYIKSQHIPVKIHAILDGRDTPPKSALQYLKNLSDHHFEIATISGRYYAMDRDKRWDRTKLAYEAIALGSGPHFADIAACVNSHYADNITDEFIKPHVAVGYTGINDGDAVILTNYRADRMRQIANSLADLNFNEFNTQRINFSSLTMMTSYAEALESFYAVMFKHAHPENTLGEVIANSGMKQLRIAETEKYAHVTYFFNGGKEQVLAGEERILLPSPKVATYDLSPHMAASEITQQLSAAISQEKFNFICVDYANADMVGHTGSLQATIKAIEKLDECLNELCKICALHKYDLLITADHGNAEEMLDSANYQPLTSHTLNPVPIIYVGNKKLSITDGSLSDVAPTVLSLLNIAIPKEMSGGNLCAKKQR